MGFLDNSGDIILDAVLTDAGRQRLARGDGSFRISQFAFGDDEINYGLFNKSTGSAYQDAEILTTPILEAFTNNVASMNSKLLTITRNNLLYLPIIKLNENNGLNSERYTGHNYLTDPTGSNDWAQSLDSILKNTFVVSADQFTQNAIKAGTFTLYSDEFGRFIIDGTGNTSQKRGIVLDQGLNNNESATTIIDADLKETDYIVEIDNRLASIIEKNNGQAVEAAKSFVDDDNIASYYFSLATDAGYVKTLAVDTPDGSNPDNSNVDGPRGTRLMFSLKSSIDIRTSEYLFDQMGQTDVISTDVNAPIKVRTIKSNVVITGATTGYSITVPVSFVKFVSL
jgi:hypothetical protein